MKTLLAALCIAGIACVASAQPCDLPPCDPSWSDQFPTSELAGSVIAMAWFDDGSGPALFVGGDFKQAAGQPVAGVARWDGSTWSPVGDGIDGTVWDLVVFDDGSGPALYAGGQFTQAGGQPPSYIARWDGAHWELLGAGTNNTVRSLAVFDDGQGDALYAGGLFSAAGGAEANRVARWDGSEWSALGAGISGSSVLTLAALDTGDGDALYAGGDFQLAGGAPASYIARWDGLLWSPVGQAGPNLGRPVRSLAVSAPDHRLFAGLLNPGGVYSLGDGGWAPVGSVQHGDVLSLASFAGEVYAGGTFTLADHQLAGYVARWNGQAWSQAGLGTNKMVRKLLVADTGNGPVLYAGGAFSEADHAQANRVATWTGAAWSGFTGVYLGSPARAMIGFDDGQGAAMYAGGDFEAVGGLSGAGGLARYNGSNWTPAGDGSFGHASAFVVFDAGDGPRLHAGGYDEGAREPVVAAWNGGSWTPLGPPTQGPVTDMVVMDSGAGPELFISGYFTSDDSSDGVLKWTGAQWDPVGANSPSEADLEVFDDGSGPALYAAKGEVPSVLRWDLETWQPVADLVKDGGIGSAYVLGVFDDGSGAALIAGGDFDAIDGVAARNIARWDGQQWSALSDGLDSAPHALVVFDDGRGPALFAGGDFTTAGDQAARSIARWDGLSWTPVDGGIDGPVVTLAVADLGSGSTLLASGEFFVAGSHPSGRLAALNGCPRTCAADCTGEGALDLFDFLCFVNGFVAEDPAADCTADGFLDLFDFLCFVNAFNEGC